MFENKKAQGLSTTTIILIILGVIILVVLVFGFTMGWDNLKDWVAPSDNVEKVVTKCSVACAAGIKADWCKAQGLVTKDHKEDLKNNNCQVLGEINGNPYGISPCPEIGKC